MSEALLITSLQNPTVKQIIKLKDRREREKTKKFIVEGYRELLRCFEGGGIIETLCICEELFLGVNEKKLIAQIASSGAKILRFKETIFRKFSYRDRPDGLLALVLQSHFPLTDLKWSPKKAPLFVIAESIEKPGNLGTILRSCDAFGVDALIVCDRCTDLHNPNVVRASVGTLFTVPVFEAKGEEVLSWVKDNQITLVATTPQATCSLTEVDLTGPVAIAIGTEQLGLSQAFLEKAKLQVKIPMRGVADSLNVAMATTLFLFEARRQRDGRSFC